MLEAAADPPIAPGRPGWAKAAVNRRTPKKRADASKQSGESFEARPSAGPPGLRPPEGESADDPSTPKDPFYPSTLPRVKPPPST